MKTLYSIGAALLVMVPASFAVPLEVATLSGTYYINQSGSLKSFTANNTTYLTLAAILENRPKSDFVVAIDKNDGVVGVFRRSNGTRVFKIIEPTTNVGAVSNAAGTDNWVVSAVNIFTPANINTSVAGGAVSRAKFSASGKVLSQSTTFHGGGGSGAGGIVIKGTVGGGAQVLFAP